MKSPLLPAVFASCLACAPALAVQVAYYNFESGSGNVVDLEPVNAGNNMGTLQGNAAYGVSVPSNAPAPSNFSLALDGDGDYVSLANPGPLLRNVSGFTLAAFVNIAAFAGGTSFDSVIFVSNPTAAGNQARATLQIGANGQIAIGGRRADADSFARHVSSNGLITANGWHHVAATVDFSSGTPLVSLYHNGSLVTNTLATAGSFSAGSATSNTDSAVATLGAQGTGTAEFVQGNIDDARIYNHVLSASEIMAIAVPEPSTSLLALVGALALLRRRR